MKKVLLGLLSLIIVFGFTFTAEVQSEEAETGKDVFVAKKCNQCHAVEACEIEAKIKNKYPDLSSLSGDYDAEFLKKYLLKEEKINNKNHLMKFSGSDDELTAIVDWIIKVNEKNKTEE